MFYNYINWITVWLLHWGSNSLAACTNCSWWKKGGNKQSPGVYLSHWCPAADVIQPEWRWYRCRTVCDPAMLSSIQAFSWSDPKPLIMMRVMWGMDGVDDYTSSHQSGEVRLSDMSDLDEIWRTIKWQHVSWTVTLQKGTCSHSQRSYQQDPKIWSRMETPTRPLWAWVFHSHRMWDPTRKKHIYLPGSELCRVMRLLKLKKSRHVLFERLTHQGQSKDT